ncbi:MAG: ATP synthase F1 subunit gamma [Planctomycetota bacterium]|jgi:F-type H+-transporting ATPase subunit gamma
MAKAKVLLKRRKSVRNTKKITRTMEMVSTAKYKQSFTRIQNSAPYQEKLREMMGDLASAGAEISHPLLESRPVKRSLVLVLTSNRGLCGGYNANLTAVARDLLVKERGENVEAELHVVGKKGIQFFRARRERMEAQHDHFGDSVAFADVNELADEYIRRYATGEIDRVTIVFQKWLSGGHQAPVAETLLPLGDVAADVAGGTAEGAEGADRAAEGTVESGAGASMAARNYLYSPDPDSLMRELLPAYFKTTLYSDFLQAVVGEHRARMVAMKNATDAADKLIKSLTQQYNRARQSQITNEIAELMGGVEALK